MKNIEIIYENKEILVINKPAGISVQGGEGVNHPLDEELSRQLGYKIYLIHRLDKETSGLMVVAKNSNFAAKWISLISGKLVKKEYTAICFDKPLVRGKICDNGILRDSVVKNGKEMSACTEFDVIDSGEVEIDSKEEKYKVTFSKLHLTLGTGRMHQIRIHLAKAGCPIVQDDKHGNFKMNKIIRPLKIKTLCLASTKLTIPENGKNKVFEIELPEHMKKIERIMNS